MLGDRLRELRTEKRLTQTELAETIGISRGTYAHYEINKRQPDFDTLKKLADFFDVSADYLLGRTDKPDFVIVDSSNPSAITLKRKLERRESGNTNIEDVLEEALGFHLRNISADIKTNPSTLDNFINELGKLGFKIIPEYSYRIVEILLQKIKHSNLEEKTELLEFLNQFTNENGIKSNLSDSLKVDYEEMMDVAGYIDKPREEIIHEPYDSLAEITKYVQQLGITSMGFLDIEKWKNLGPEEVEEIKRHFDYVLHKAMEKKKQQGN